TFMAFLTSILLGLWVIDLPIMASETDRKIEDAAKQTYAFKHDLKDDHVQIESKAGVVTLTGTVLDPSHKSLAENTVQSLLGVKTVNNQLAVTDEAPTVIDNV